MPAEGLQRSDVDAYRQEVDEAIDGALASLRRIEAAAQNRLHHATVEQQQLDIFLDELHYRLQFLSQPREDGARPITITGPLTDDQLGTMQRQEDALQERKQELRKANTELQQISTRVSWLIHQIEGAGAWVLAPSEMNAEGEATPGLQPDSGEMVMWAQIIMGQEAERARLAREIHDGPAQALANTVMRLQLVEQMFKHRPDEVRGELARLRVAVQDSLKDVRRFVFNLRPASLSDVGLVSTLQQHTRDYAEQYGVHVELNVPDNLVLSADQELVVFRIIQEALQNIHKHAEATRVDVDLQQRRGGPLIVNITDDGKGFNPKLARQRQPSSSGLVSMRERAATVGGTLQIDSKPGSGTTITLTLPMPKESQR
jgi:two-component system, NarL family, sensor histidine kinase DegS